LYCFDYGGNECDFIGKKLPRHRRKPICRKRNWAPLRKSSRIP
jgi:hypothetical protein